MGQSASNNNQIPDKTFFSKVEVIAKNQPSQFGEVGLVREVETGRELTLKKIILQNRKAFDTQLEYYYTRINNPHLNLINVVGYKSKVKRAFCSEQYIIKVYLESLTKTMENELFDHISYADPISEIELQLLSQHLITVLAEFQQKDIVHGDIRPANIYVTEEAYKLCDPSFVMEKNISSVAQVALFGSKVFLAPELIKQVLGEDFEVKCNKFKADVFSLGMTLLSLATLTQSEDLYNYEKGTINYTLMESRLNNVERAYSPQFVQHLRELLTIDAEHRPDFLQLSGKFVIAETLRAYHNLTAAPEDTKVLYVKIAKTLGEAKKEELRKSFIMEEAYSARAIKTPSESKRSPTKSYFLEENYEAKGSITSSETKKELHTSYIIENTYTKELYVQSAMPAVVIQTPSPEVIVKSYLAVDCAQAPVEPGSYLAFDQPAVPIAGQFGQGFDIKTLRDSSSSGKQQLPSLRQSTYYATQERNLRQSAFYSNYVPSLRQSQHL